MYHNFLAWTLSLAGLLPVVAVALLLYYQTLESVVMITFLHYLSTIQAFLAGTSWAFSLQRSSFSWGLIFAISFALLPWVTSMHTFFVRLTLACVSFLALLGFDYVLVIDDAISDWYFKLRLIITCIMLSLLFFIMAQL